ncbi:hypothetical protein ACH5RR_032030 [Cinchona calisaya]|uniref:Sulfotransferase n=1 Tax=Cinchona calisaya TaxID=153742 RepID=A0ABD2YI06_9GENT
MPNIELLEQPFVHFPNPKSFTRAECACKPDRHFAILSTQRSGSGWFETLLNSHINISSNGEIFSVKPWRTNSTTIVETLDKLYNLDFLPSASKWIINQGLMQHHEEITEYFKNRAVFVIFFLRRNLWRRMVSLLANSYDLNAELLNGTHKSHVHSLKEAEILASYKPTIHATMLIGNLRQVEEMVSTVGLDSTIGDSKPDLQVACESTQQSRHLAVVPVNTLF